MIKALKSKYVNFLMKVQLRTTMEDDEKVILGFLGGLLGY